MRLVDTIAIGREAWLKRHHCTLEFLQDPRLQEYLKRKHGLDDLHLVLRPGKRRPFGNKPLEAMTVSLAMVDGVATWLRFTSGMLRHLASCRRDPARIPLVLAQDAKHLLAVEAKPIKVKPKPSDLSDILCAVLDSEDKAQSPMIIQRNPLGFNGDVISQGRGTRNYEMVVERYRSIISFLLEGQP